MIVVGLIVFVSVNEKNRTLKKITLKNLRNFS